jgi:hypothetical protein
MSRALMRRHCPLARPLGTAMLDHHRFIMMNDGYASIATQPGARVHGVLWRLAPRERQALDAFENIAARLYRRAILPVRHDGRRLRALAYVGHSQVPGRPQPGYLELVLSAARDWALPSAYVEEIARWGSPGPRDDATTNGRRPGPWEPG